MKKPNVSLLISVYNWPEALELVLKSIEIQTIKPNEIVIADDGSDIRTKKLIIKFSKKSAIPVQHSWHKDFGDRRVIARNKAIASAKYEYIIFIDGDMILHKNFIEDHLKFSKPNCFTHGVRAKIKKEAIKEIFEEKIINFKPMDDKLKSKRFSIRNYFLSSIFSGNNIFNKKEGLLGCNMAFYKKDCVSINGFNEEIMGWGRDDTEFGVRMAYAGFTKRVLCFKAVAYHIHHEGTTRKNLDKNHEIFLKTVKSRLIFCKHGINKYLSR